MITAAQRLQALSGLGAASAAHHLKHIAAASGLAAGALLVAYSGLGAASAATHLLVDHGTLAPYGSISYWRLGPDPVALELHARASAWPSAPAPQWPLPAARTHWPQPAHALTMQAARRSVAVWCIDGASAPAWLLPAQRRDTVAAIGPPDWLQPHIVKAWS